MDRSADVLGRERDEEPLECFLPVYCINARSFTYPIESELRLCVFMYCVLSVSVSVSDSFFFLFISFSF